MQNDSHPMFKIPILTVSIVLRSLSPKFSEIPGNEIRVITKIKIVTYFQNTMVAYAHGKN